MPKEDLIVEVFQSGTEYNRRITWTKDIANKKTIGFIILEGLTYNARNNHWEKIKSMILIREELIVLKQELNQMALLKYMLIKE